MSAKLSKDSEMSSAVAAIDPARECRVMTHEVGRSLPAHLTVGARIAAVTRELGMRFPGAVRIARACWYGEAGAKAYFEVKPRFDLWRRLHAAEVAQNSGLITLLEAMHASDQEFYSLDIAALREALVARGALVRPNGGQDRG